MKEAFKWALYSSVFLCAIVAHADDKSKLYEKGIASVTEGDPFAARDAFCTVAKKDDEYKDAEAQCQTYTAAADRVLMRYKVNFAEGMSAMQHGDYTTAEMKFRGVRQGEFAEPARVRLAELDRLKEQSAKERSAAFMETMTIGESGGRFAFDCGRNGGFEKENESDPQNTRAFFCAGWVRGATELLRAQQSKLATKSLCLPAEMNVGEETAMFLKYIKEHAQENGKPASALSETALRKSYPCKAKK